MISTKPFKVDPKEHFNMYLRDYFNKLKWYILVMLICLLAVSFIKPQYLLYIIGFAVFFTLFMLFSIWRNSYSRNDKWLRMERMHSFHTDKFTTEMEGAFSSDIAYRHLYKIDIKESFVMLYINKHSFVYVPYKAFEKEPDAAEFRRLMHHVDVHILGNYKKGADTVIDQ